MPVVTGRIDNQYEEILREAERRLFSVRESEKANDRARELFLSLLTPKQTKEFAEKGYITVEGGTTKHKYIILQGVSGNVYYKGGRTTYCCHMRIPAPVFDHMIAQMFNLRYNEKDFLAKAYTSRY